MPNYDSINLNKQKLNAIFFDFDGVLADSLAIKADAFLSLFNDAKQEQRSAISQHFYRYTGRSRQDKFQHVYQHILGEPLSDQKLQQLSDQFKQRCMNAVIESSEIKGANNLLNAIPEHILCFVVSGTPEVELQHIISERGMAKHFLQSRGTPTAKEHNIAQLLEQYQLTPKHCLMLGDGLVDKQAADFNEMPFAGIVALGETSPFPRGTETFADLNAVAQQLNLLKMPTASS